MNTICRLEFLLKREDCLMVECDKCVYRHSCGKSAHECRDNHGGRLDYEKLYHDLKDKCDKNEK